MNNWKKFKESLRLKIDFIHVILLDLVFYLIMIPFTYLAVFLIHAQADKIDITGLQSAVAAETPDLMQMQAIMGDLKAFIIMVVVTAILFLIIGLFAYSFSRSLIWNYLLKKKLRIGKYLKFVLLNLMLVIPAVVLFVIPFVFMGASVIASAVIWYILMIAFAYFVFTIYMEYTRKGRIFSSIGNAFKRINKKTAVSYVLCLLAFTVLFAAYLAVSWVLKMEIVGATILFIVLAILYCAWMRLYVLKVQS